MITNFHIIYRLRLSGIKPYNLWSFSSCSQLYNRIIHASRSQTN